ncbi:MAG: hypothetical protein Q8M92_10565 [Candidatus Subteraquimicrobiales bacterium]|nr:hypothetical protein [Candidatus Subteraquimicrobiales bacterium]
MAENFFASSVAKAQQLMKTTLAESKKNEATFLDSATRGRIKLIPDDESKSIILRAEDVSVGKKLPLTTSTGLDGTDESVQPKQEGADTGDGASATAEMEPTLVIKFKLTITPKDMKRAAFKEKRANYLFDFEAKTFTAVSDMFRKATTMQFTDIQYVIPSGEESAQYLIEMTQVEVAEDDRTKTEKAKSEADITDYVNGDGMLSPEQIQKKVKDAAGVATKPP